MPATYTIGDRIAEDRILTAIEQRGQMPRSDAQALYEAHGTQVALWYLMGETPTTIAARLLEA